MTAWEAGRRQKALYLAFAASACSNMLEPPLRKPTRLKKNFALISLFWVKKINQLSCEVAIRVHLSPMVS